MDFRFRVIRQEYTACEYFMPQCSEWIMFDQERYIQFVSKIFPCIFFFGIKDTRSPVHESLF
jgi:hypothetical protein